MQATTKEHVVIATVVRSTKSPIVAEMKTRGFQEQNPRREMAPMNASGAHHARQPQAKAAAYSEEMCNRFQYLVYGFVALTAASSCP